VIEDDAVAHPSRAAGGQLVEDVCQLAEPELGGSTTAARVLCQADRGLRFGRHDGNVAARMIRGDIERASVAPAAPGERPFYLSELLVAGHGDVELLRLHLQLTFRLDRD
jgi:hypothetical protein